MRMTVTQRGCKALWSSNRPGLASRTSKYLKQLKTDFARFRTKSVLAALSHTQNEWFTFAALKQTDQQMLDTKKFTLQVSAELLPLQKQTV